MQISYYKNKSLTYASRNRYRDISKFVPFYTENQKSILLGDGATTNIKTSSNNICDYVTIDNTRWFVVSYIYLNGGQVRLNLQRDVVGEQGLEGCYGKIERGFTDNILKYRKELNLNQVLKERKYLIPDSKKYFNYSVDNHNNELWGILYLTNTENKTIQIPEFAPTLSENNYIVNGTRLISSYEKNIYLDFLVNTTDNDGVEVLYKVHLDFLTNKKYNITITQNSSRAYSRRLANITHKSFSNNTFNREAAVRSFSNIIGYNIANLSAENSIFVIPSNLPTITENIIDYSNAVIKNEDKYYSYTMTSGIETNNYTIGSDENIFSYIKTILSNTSIKFNNNSGNEITINITNDNFNTSNIIYFSKSSSISSQYYQYNAIELTAEQAGEIVLKPKQNLVDEPYTILVMPLFDCTITSLTSEYKVSRKTCFMVFNTIIEKTSGDNPYLADAQVYPYCPDISELSTSLNGIPLFYINASSFIRDCTVQLLPSSDIKKEYIERQYSIISPEQTGKFDFSFYDFINNVEDNNGVNYAKMTIKIKTSLKPFSIITSAVIQPTLNSLIGITYESDLRGSQASSSGFECSLSSNAFETYARQNSNYQNIFKLQQQELQMQHSVERVNEITSAVVNTTTATAMGAIAGASLGGNTTVGKAVGGSIGGATAGVTVGTAMTIQAVTNQKLREYEESLQQQTFDLQIGTIKNLPNSLNRVSSFNEIILKDFWYIIETYECTDEEKEIVDNFIQMYGYGIGVFDFVLNYYKNGWFLRSTLISSGYNANLHMIVEKELKGGIYLYE